MEVVVRRALPTESDQVAQLLWRVRQENVGSLPPSLHVLDNMQRWMRDVVFATSDVWVAEVGGELVALMVLHGPHWLEQLYVDGAHTGNGVGLRLLQIAQQELPDRIELWTFKSNVGARRFYEREGFEAVEETDGDNEEGAPDVRYVWTGQ